MSTLLSGGAGAAALVLSSDRLWGRVGAFRDRGLTGNTRGAGGAAARSRMRFKTVSIIALLTVVGCKWRRGCLLLKGASNSSKLSRSSELTRSDVLLRGLGGAGTAREAERGSDMGERSVGSKVATIIVLLVPFVGRWNVSCLSGRLYLQVKNIVR
jgi:hypothetical protein